MSLFPVPRYDDGDSKISFGNDAVEQDIESKRLSRLLNKAKIKKLSFPGDEGVKTESLGTNRSYETEKWKYTSNQLNSKAKSQKSVIQNSVTAAENGDVEMSESVKTEGDNANSKTVESCPSRSPKARKSKSKKKKVINNNELGIDLGGFTLIGDTSQFKQQTVKRVLPHWLANPSIVSCDLQDDRVPIDSLGLDEDIVRVLKHNLYPFFFPVQQQVIPWLISTNCPKLFRPSDLCVSAPTGSGKTLAYVLPIVHILKQSYIRAGVKAIVVLPTEVLATQVYSVFFMFCKDSVLSVFLMSKRLTLQAERGALIKTGVNDVKYCPFDIIITTPGRLIEHLEGTEAFNISMLQFLVIDEADRTAEDQDGEWLHRLERKFWSYWNPGVSQPWKYMPLTVKWMTHHLKSYQKLLFSATLSQNPETLERLNLFQPKLYTSIVQSASENDKEHNMDVETTENVTDSFIGKYTTPKELTESFVLCKKETKPLVLTSLISKFKWKRVLCFANTKESTHRLCQLLKHMGHVSVKEISSKWSPKARDFVLKKFSNGELDMLVTSDQLARGIDIPTVDFVISYDLPGYTKTYIHRIGRCARAGRTGKAICLVTQEQMGIYKKTMKHAGKTTFDKIPIKNSDLREYETSFRDALAKLKEEITTKSSG